MRSAAGATAAQLNRGTWPGCLLSRRFVRAPQHAASKYPTTTLIHGMAFPGRKTAGRPGGRPSHVFRAAAGRAVPQLLGASPPRSGAKISVHVHPRTYARFRRPVEGEITELPATAVRCHGGSVRVDAPVLASGRAKRRSKCT
jgi:hypothetical protein